MRGGGGVGISGEMKGEHGSYANEVVDTFWRFGGFSGNERITWVNTEA